jgi:hypothetical protein
LPDIFGNEPAQVARFLKLCSDLGRAFAHEIQVINSGREPFELPDYYWSKHFNLNWGPVRAGTMDSWNEAVPGIAFRMLVEEFLWPKQRRLTTKRLSRP